MENLSHDISSQITALEELQQQHQKNLGLAQEIDAIYQHAQLPIVDPAARYAANMTAFKQYIPDIHASFIDYQPTKFELAQRHGELHLVDAEDNVVLGEHYYRDSLIDFEKYRFNPQLTRIDFSDEIDNPINFVHVKYINQLTNLVSKVNQQHKQELILPEAVNMMVCFGLGLGYYLPLMLSKHQVKRLYIYEPEHDFFYASLFTLDWAAILQQLDANNSSLHLCLGANEDDFFSDISSELIAKGRYDSTFSFCYKHYATEQMDKALDKFNKQAFQVAFGFGFFDDSLLALAHQYHNLNKHVPLLGRVEPLPECATLPVFILANGPSLDEHIDYIIANRDKVLLVSCGTTIRALHQYGIKPDFHLEMERTRVTHSVLQSVGDDAYLKSIPLLTLNTISPDVLDLFDRQLMALKMVEPSTEIIMNPALGCDHDNLAQLMYCNPTVANLALSFFTQMGFKNIYLFGVDLGFSGDAHHSKKSIYYDKSGQDKQLFNKKALANLVAPGNHVDEVETTMIFQMSAAGLTALLRLNPEVNCYNLGEGIRIDNTIPTYQTDICLPDNILNKALFVAQILAHYSVDTHVLAQQYSHILQQNIFAEFVDEMLALLQPSVSDRYAALEQLQQQFILLHSKYETKDAFLADMLRGTLQHCHASLIKLLLLPASAEQGLAYYQQGIVIFVDYLKETKVKYNKELLEADKTDMSATWQ